MKQSKIKLEQNNKIPNNEVLPVLLYKSVFQKDLENNFKNALERNNWGGIWINGVYDYHHYHSNSHEALGVLSGTAALILGGQNGKEMNVSKGDLIVLPAGTGHCLKESSSDFQVMGAYPAGQEDYDICTEKDDVELKKRSIAKVSLPGKDPIEGEDGFLIKTWKY